MKTWLKENWLKIGLLAILVISITGAFYWFEWRPNQIRKRCYDISLIGWTQNGEINYQNCLKNNGLER